MTLNVNNILWISKLLLCHVIYYIMHTALVIFYLNIHMITPSAYSEQWVQVYDHDFLKGRI